MKKTWSDKEIDRVANRLKAIASPFRLAIICALADGELCVQEICDQLASSQPNISQHLLVLYNRHLLVSRKEANRVYYAIADPNVLKLIGTMRQIYCPQD
jgi:ArsR family transcriptional regulator